MAEIKKKAKDIDLQHTTQKIKDWATRIPQNSVYL